MSLLCVKDLQVRYGEENRESSVRHLSFSMEKKEIIGIVGASGSGKSTTLLALMGLLGEKATVTYEQMQFSGKKIAMVFQDPSAYLNPLVLIGTQLVETIRIHTPCSKKEAKEKAEELLDLVGIREPKRRMRQYPFELSGGMCQRIVIAIALASGADLILADEPTTALDVTVQRQILDLLKSIVEQTDTSVLIVSHDMGVVGNFCDRVLVMEKGTLVEEGRVEDIFQKPQHPYTKQLLKDTQVEMQSTKTFIEEEPLLCAKDLSRCFQKKDKFVAVEQVSFQIYKSETFGLVGESGSGKTTLAKMLSGLLPPTSGSITGTKKVQMVFQNPYASLNPRFSIKQILEEPLLLQGKYTKGQREAKVIEMLELVGISKEDKEKKPQAFSGGQRQRIAIARALIQEPELLICDEAVSALDVTIQRQILNLLQRLQREKQFGMLFISHDLSVVRYMSQRMAVMFAGKMVEIGETQKLYEEPWHPYTKQLLSATLLPFVPRYKNRKKAMFREKKEVWIPQKAQGCVFAGQCGYEMQCCKKERPDGYLFENREVRCFLYSSEHTGKRSLGYQMSSQI